MPSQGQDRSARVRVLGRSALLVVSGSPDAKSAAIATTQRGRVARRQLLMAELSSKMISIRVSRGSIYPVHAGVYAVGHTATVDLGAETAALLAAGAGAVLSHDTAAVLWKLRRPPLAAVPIHLSVPACGCPRRPGICAHRTRTLLPRDVRLREGLPVTSPARTLLDIAGGLPPRALELALDEALRSRVVTPAQVLDVLARIPNRRGEQALARAEPHAA